MRSFIGVSVILIMFSCKHNPNASVKASRLLSDDVSTKQLKAHESQIEKQLPHFRYEIVLDNNRSDSVLTGSSSWPNSDCAEVRKALASGASTNGGVQKKYADLLGFKVCEINRDATKVSGSCVIAFSCAQPIVDLGETRYVSLLDGLDYQDQSEGDDCVAAFRLIKSIDGKNFDTKENFGMYTFTGNETSGRVKHRGCRFVTSFKP